MEQEYTPGRQLRSAGSRLLRVPRHNLERYCRRDFLVTAPRLWNDLPDSLRLIDSVLRKITFTFTQPNLFQLGGSK